MQGFIPLPFSSLWRIPSGRWQCRMRRNTLVFLSFYTSVSCLGFPFAEPSQREAASEPAEPRKHSWQEPCAGMQSRACEKTERHRLNLRASRPGPGASAWPERGSGFPGASVLENPPADPGGPGHAGEVGSIPVSGRSPRGGNGNPLQYSCLENPMDRGAWRVIVHWGRKESDTTEQPNTH